MRWMGWDGMGWYYGLIDSGEIMDGWDHGMDYG